MRAQRERSRERVGNRAMTRKLRARGRGARGDRRMTRTDGRVEPLLVPPSLTHKGRGGEL